ncbi:MAG: hypothetical protein AABZ08_01455 [Planctomycetota bacterium]
MFFWTTGMSPIVTLLIFIIGTIFVVYSMAGAFKWTCGWGEEDMRRAGAWRCTEPKCRASNPSHARFCRMCGKKHDA